MAAPENVVATPPAPPETDEAATNQAAANGVAGAAEQAPPPAPSDGAAPSLKQALAKTEADATSTLKAAAAATSAVRRVQTAAKTGSLRDLRSSFDAAERALETLGEELAKARRGWDFDEDAYFAGDAYTRELLQTARQMGVRIYEQDDRLYSYPSLVRVLPNERTVLIDKTRERRLRPTVLVAHLADLQKKPARFRPEVFLEALANAYTIVVDAKAGQRKDDLIARGTAVSLLDVYNVLTLLPGQAREYSRQEFARDVYLLDQSGARTTRRGATVSFPASTGTKGRANVLRVIAQDGHEKTYFGIAFHGGT